MNEDVSFGEPRTLRARAGRFFQLLVPNLDARAFFRARNRDVRSRLSSGVYNEWLGGRLGPSSSTTRDAGYAHVVVIPYEGRDFESWKPGTRNFYFEAAQLLSEIKHPACVSVFHVAPGESFDRWHTRLIDHLNDVGATHILTHIEGDPGTQDGTWTWDSAWSLISQYWDGVLLGVMFDSAYRHTLLKGRYLARMSPRFVLVDICVPMDGELVRGRPEVGPVNMPMSDVSMELVNQRISEVEIVHDLSFVGVLYPYRVELIAELRSRGLSVVVNPHRKDDAKTRAETLVNQPKWLDYMAGLASSRATINFSESAARPVQQLKTRVLEAGLARTLLFTDDTNLTSRFWIENQEYGYFAKPRDLPKVVEDFLGDSERVNEARMRFAMRARHLARSGFWQQIDATLLNRKLPRILD